MRLIVLLSLLATVSPPSCCERRNAQVCANEAGYECDDGQLCQVQPGAMFGTCIQAECGVGQATCPADRPLCISGNCKACEVDAECAAQDSATPVCIAGACVACRDGGQCKEADRKVCDAVSHTCRGCQLHSECSPGVCAKDDAFASLTPPILPGSCVDVSRVTDVDGSTCPNCLGMIISTGVSTAKPYVRIGRYSNSVSLRLSSLPAGLPRYYIIGPLADLRATQITTNPQMNLSSGSSAAIELQGGVHATLEGVVISNSVTGLDCNSKSSVPTGVPTKVAIVRSLLGGNQTAIRASAHCELDIDQTWIGKGPTVVFAGIARNDTAMVLDSTRLRLVNSVLWDNGKSTPLFGGIRLSDSAGLRKAIHMVHSTFARLAWPSMEQALAVDCDYATAGSLAIVNSLFLNEDPVSIGSTYVHGRCRPNGSLSAVGSNEADLGGVGNATDLTSSGVFVDAANGNLRLQTAAPASVTNGGIASFTDGTGASVSIPKVDFEGKARGPGGSATVRSLGAFEVSR